jgi:hypothetical protein
MQYCQMFWMGGIDMTQGIVWLPTPFEVAPPPLKLAPGLELVKLARANFTGR